MVTCIGTIFDWSVQFTGNRRHSFLSMRKSTMYMQPKLLLRMDSWHFPWVDKCMGREPTWSSVFFFFLFFLLFFYFINSSFDYRKLKQKRKQEWELHLLHFRKVIPKDISVLECFIKIAVKWIINHFNIMKLRNLSPSF